MEGSERIFEPDYLDNVDKPETRLRPKNFSEYVGQNRILDNVKVMVESARIREQAMDHLLLSGPPGLGKTSLAMIIAHELGVQLHVVSGPAIEKKGDLAAILTGLEPRDLLFIDEIHRMHISVEEILYSAMEDFRLDIVIGQGAAAKTMKIDLAPFTLVGATTRSGLLSNPLRDRFMGDLHFDFYEPSDLEKILSANSKKLKLPVSPQALKTMSHCARGTPRIANRILRRVRDFAVVGKQTEIGQAEVTKALELMEIDSFGLDRMDRKILTVITDYYNGGPVGIEALSATLGEDRQTIEEVYEPYLLKEGFLLRTPRGREVSSRGHDLLQKAKT